MKSNMLQSSVLSPSGLDLLAEQIHILNYMHHSDNVVVTTKINFWIVVLNLILSPALYATASTKFFVNKVWWQFTCFAVSMTLDLDRIYISQLTNFYGK